MSCYYCEYHGTFHDGDHTPCVEHPNGSNDLLCEDAAMEIEEEREEALKPNRNRAFNAGQLAFIAKCESEDICEMESDR